MGGFAPQQGPFSGELQPKQEEITFGPGASPLANIAGIAGKFFEGLSRGRIARFAQDEQKKSSALQTIGQTLTTVLQNPNITDEKKQEFQAKATSILLPALQHQLGQSQQGVSSDHKKGMGGKIAEFGKQVLTGLAGGKLDATPIDAHAVTDLMGDFKDLLTKPENQSTNYVSKAQGNMQAAAKNLETSKGYKPNSTELLNDPKFQEALAMGQKYDPDFQKKFVGVPGKSGFLGGFEEPPAAGTKDRRVYDYIRSKKSGSGQQTADGGATPASPVKTDPPPGGELRSAADTAPPGPNQPFTINGELASALKDDGATNGKLEDVHVDGKLTQAKWVEANTLGAPEGWYDKDNKKIFGQVTHALDPADKPVKEDVKNLPGSAVSGKKDAFGHAVDPKGVYTLAKDGELYPEAPPPKDPVAQASLEASRSLADTLKRLQISEQPTKEDAEPVAKDLVNHRLAPDQLTYLAGSFGAQGAAFRRMVYTQAKKLDPNFDFEEASAEYALVKSPGFQNTIRYMDSVNESIPLVIRRAKELGNGNIRFVNGLVNMSAKQLSDPTLKKFQTDALLVADEIGKILQGGGSGNGTSDKKLEQAVSIIDTSASPEAISAALDDVRELLGFRRTALTRGTYMEKRSAPPGASGSGSRSGSGSGGTLPGGITLDEVNAEIERRKKAK